MERRFFIDENKIKNAQVEITGEQYHYVVHVLRLTRGEKIVLIGQKYQFKAVIAEVTKAKLVAKISSKKLIPISPLKIDLFQGLPKSSKFEFIIEKSTELGVDQIYPLLTERTVVTLEPAKTAKKLSRWQKIALEAARQSRRLSVPEVKPPLPFKELLEKLSSYSLSLVFWEESTSWLNEQQLKPLKEGRLAIIIGPEGGFSQQEVEQLKKVGALEVSLGPRILRTETAPLAALAVINFLLKR